jgi:hypothetical protein
MYRTSTWNIDDLSPLQSKLLSYILNLLSIKSLNLDVKKIAIRGCGPGQRSRYSDSLRVGWSGNRIPVGARFSAPVQIGPAATQSRVWWVLGLLRSAQSGRGVNNPPPFSAEVKEWVELYLHSPSGPSWPVPAWTLLLLDFALRGTSLRKTNKNTVKQRVRFSWTRKLVQQTAPSSSTRH